MAKSHPDPRRALPAPGADPIEVEVRRGNLVESRRRVAATVVSADGAIVATWGDVTAAVYPRSAQVVIGAVLNHLGALDGATRRAFDQTVPSTLVNWRGLPVGEIRIAGPEI